ncbi:tRNA lysidine(34) synthetase TilS [Pseudonocardia eucalypti]|uniref:tRNA(Ile)-lysidine synthase n=1 Tax=Pseudonocardia eucalypti TaxID=648755 RepID=A0ABP9QZU7_9PSEU|nr:tRNA(Ile)-lysidine synthase [Pseudonocardia eucalypti]
MRLSPEVAAVRTAVRAALNQLPPETPLLVGCSGGADSLALALAAVAVWSGPVHAAVVDHGLQEGSAEHAERTAKLLVEHGIAAEPVPVRVTGAGGTEAAARRARYTALRAARPTEHSPVLLGHTLDDQAETVLLGLGRGSGARSLAGMRVWRDPWLRPLLGIRRATTRAACTALGVPVWDDPHNADPRFTRVRLRTEVLPLLEDVLAGGVADALARTAGQLAEDGEALDVWAGRAQAACGPTKEGDETLDAQVLARYPAAVRRRVLRSWLLGLGVPELGEGHLRGCDDLVGRWRGQGAVALPGGLELTRRHGRLRLDRAEWDRPD